MKKTLIFIIRFYQSALSPFLGKNCRFEPTCSAYMIESLQVYGLFKGLFKGAKRIINCNPWGGQGYDPVKKTVKKTSATSKLF